MVDSASRSGELDTAALPAAFILWRAICDEAECVMLPTQGKRLLLTEEMCGRLGAALEPQKYDDVLVPFVALMRKELHANVGKGDRPGWLAMDANAALLEVYYHLAKLQKAAHKNDGPAIQEYSADVANMAMMVLDVCGGLAWVGAATDSAAGAQTPNGSDLLASHQRLKEALQTLVDLDDGDKPGLWDFSLELEAARSALEQAP